jgi:hypothetical protein
MPASDRHAIAVKLVILIVATLARPKIGEIAHKFDCGDPFDHLEAKLVLAAETERSSVQDAKGLTVHFVSKDGQPMPHVEYLVDVVVAASIGAVRQ